MWVSRRARGGTNGIALFWLLSCSYFFSHSLWEGYIVNVLRQAIAEFYGADPAFSVRFHHECGALDAAADYYLVMAGETEAYPNGAIQELMRLACEKGNVTPAEIAEILGDENLPIEYERKCSVGHE